MDQTLWKQIADFDFDQPVAEYGFSTRLAFENHWTVNFSADAILEYKKFMYLAAMSGRMVSPSPIVDIVWHQHLIFTQSYDAFCKILGEKIAHVPSTHDPNQASVFKEAEIWTTSQYENAFGKQPEAFWKCNTMADSLQLEPGRFSEKQVFIFGFAVFLALLYPISYLLRPVFIMIDSYAFLIGYGASMGLTFYGLKMYNDHFSDRLGQRLQHLPVIKKLTPSEVVFMDKNSIPAVIQSHINALVKDSTLGITHHKKLAIGKRRTTASPFDNAIIAAVDEINTIYYDKLVARLVNKPVFRQLVNSTAAIGNYFKKTKLFQNYFTVNYFVLLAVLLIGFARVIVGLSRGKSVGFLCLLLVVGLVLAIRHIKIEGDFFTRRCIPNLFRKSILKEATHTDDKVQDWNYFLYGNAIMAAALLPLMTNAHEKSSGFWDSSGSCGSSGGTSCGSSCGSGCGGCGGS